jgi:hypothetical protein
MCKFQRRLAEDQRKPAATTRVTRIGEVQSLSAAIHDDLHASGRYAVSRSKRASLAPSHEPLYETLARRRSLRAIDGADLIAATLTICFQNPP